MPMTHVIDATENGSIARIEGTITFKDHNRFFEIIGIIKTLSGKSMVIDLTKVDFIDSAALGMLVIANEEGSGAGVEVRIKGAHGKVMSVMEAASFDKLFKFED
ncbi:hypothetical protein FACS1894186_6550 [Alphaproteobacteria bacterium]|nr:hypothetical protein FACS1894186_6550 [Alphaproteobacteria bacterium]